MSTDLVRLHGAVVSYGSAVKPFLDALSATAFSPLSALCFIVVLVAWALIAREKIRARTVQALLMGLPEKDRITVIDREYRTTPRSGLTAEQWLRARTHVFYLVAFLSTLVVVVLLSVATIIRTKDSDKVDRGPRVETIPNQVKDQDNALQRQVDEEVRSFRESLDADKKTLVAAVDSMTGGSGANAFAVLSLSLIHI